ncbi:MAG: histone deacetylase [Cyanobacteria bacterium P01_G01_bin.4]
MLPVYYSDTFLEHLTGADHYERPARLTAIREALTSANFSNRLDWRHPGVANISDIARVHPMSYIQGVEKLCLSGGGMLDPDTPVSSKSYEVAKLAVGAWIDGVRDVMLTGKPVFVLCRPPGHHAEPEEGMGFCVFANAAIAALWALEQEEIERVAVFDWDVHHGNGTQKLFWDRSNLAYVSTHQAPLYPGTGKLEETGKHQNICNVPLPAGSGWLEYEQALQNSVMPFLRSFQPDLLLVSAGFDCGDGDPLAEMKLSHAAFGDMARMCLQVTQRCLFGLEGGYALDNLATGWLSVTKACLEVM